MAQVWFISDTHFGHANIIKYEERPFKDVNEMNKVIRKNWNATVAPEDTVFHLGDFSFRPTAEFIKSLHGKKILVRGNHDNKTNSWYRNNGFHEVYDRSIIYNQFFILSHRPLYINKNMPYANLHGHIHGHKILSKAKYFNCSVELHDYTPINFKDIIKELGVATSEFIYDVARPGEEPDWWTGDSDDTERRSTTLSEPENQASRNPDIG